MRETDGNQTVDRKDDHIRIVEEEDVETGGTGFQDIRLIHEALPEIDYDDIETSVEFLGEELSAPIVIESMTGGHPNTTALNRALAAAAEQTGIAMGVGSQRAALDDPDDGVAESYTVTREVAPNAFLYGNIGAAQLTEYGVDGVERAVEMIDADAMAIHLNFLQEAAQPEGDVDARNCLAAIETVADELSVPVIVKETGNGISRETATRLADAGVDCLDVAGKGGTTWSGVEAHRAAAANDRRHEKVGTRFRNWGLPTAVSTLEASGCHDCVVASGGVRSGLDIAKAVALGARAGGLAKPFLGPAGQGTEAVVELVEDILAELKTGMFVTGSATVGDLQDAEYVVLGRTETFLDQR
ncbi:type 2 isopentenyl-diphosphate Delta-isomerase [Halovenus salina]|uniref:Isopentenyl-diphosphate delta-isomerase n=1 Tax=Halovenus salina TaxID=1510225 RepID=A0ABD5W107_9EURY|nr:type 2 isopentenyl-diphosphate Delta-isomerase [Halovenus salina]